MGRPLTNAAGIREEPEESWGPVSDLKMGSHTTEGLHCLKYLTMDSLGGLRGSLGVAGPLPGDVGWTFAGGSGSCRG